MPGSQRLCVRAPFSALCLFPTRLVDFLPGAGESTFPAWLRSLMTICCCGTDCYLQNVAISTLLEVINHSQSLALVIEDKMRRYKSSGYSPFLGKLQMVTVPPIAPGTLKVIAEKTDFYQVFPAGERGVDPGSSSWPMCKKLSPGLWPLW